MTKSSCFSHEIFFAITKKRNKRKKKKNWRSGVSIPVPHRCKRCALPNELDPHTAIVWVKWENCFCCEVDLFLGEQSSLCLRTPAEDLQRQIASLLSMVTLQHKSIIETMGWGFLNSNKRHPSQKERDVIYAILHLKPLPFPPFHSWEAEQRKYFTLIFKLRARNHKLHHAPIEGDHMQTSRRDLFYSSFFSRNIPHDVIKMNQNEISLLHFIQKT